MWRLSGLLLSTWSTGPAVEVAARQRRTDDRIGRLTAHFNGVRGLRCGSSLITESLKFG